jgi:hypothetical protein
MGLWAIFCRTVIAQGPIPGVVTLPRRLPTGQHVIPADWSGTSIAFNSSGLAGSSPSHIGQEVRSRTTGMRRNRRIIDR